MNQTEYDHMIVQNMLHLNELTKLDTVWLSKDNFQIIHALINHPIPSDIDFKLKDYTAIEALCFDIENAFYCLASTIGQIEFILIPLNHMNQKKGLIKIGPFITNPMDDKKLSEMMSTLNLSLRHRQEIHNFYSSLSLVPSHYTNNLGHIGINLFVHQHASPKMTTYHSSRFFLEPTMISLGTDKKTIVERRYVYEKQLRKAVADGDIKQLRKEVEAMDTFVSFIDRFPDNPLRSSKNMSLALNTLLRISAEDGGLHPIYVDQISDKYAKLIEKTTTLTGLTQLKALMFEDYATTVNLHAYPQVSPLIRKIIDSIKLDLHQPLSVSSLALRFGLKPSNLANRFKKETNKTVSDFINTLRIQESLYYLKNSTLSISEISSVVGYPDQNYFTRMFKKYQHISPNQYRKSHFTHLERPEID